MLALVSPEDIGAIRGAATTGDERFWSEALERSFQVLLVAARDVLKAAELDQLREALDNYSRRVEMVQSTLMLSQSLGNLQQLRGTRSVTSSVLAEQTKRLNDARPALDDDDRAVIDAIIEGFREKIRLRTSDPHEAGRQVEVRFTPVGPNTLAFRGDSIVPIVKSILLIATMGQALRTCPRSPGAKRVYRELLALVTDEVEGLAKRLGLGASQVVSVEPDELVENTEPYEAIPDERLDTLLERNKRATR